MPLSVCRRYVEWKLTMTGRARTEFCRSRARGRFAPAGGTRPTGVLTWAVGFAALAATGMGADPQP